MLLQPRRRVTQPQGPVEIDWANPLTRGLVFADAGPRLGYSRSLGFTGANFVSGSVSEVSAHVGAAVSIDAEGSSYFSYGAAAQIGPPLTILSVYVLTVAPTIAGRLFGNVLASNYGYALAPNATNARLLLSRSGANLVLTGAPHALGRVKVDVGVVDAASARLFENGVLTAGPTGHGGVATATGVLRIGADNSGSAGVRHVNFGGMVWARALSPAEVAAVSANPWQLFRPLPARLLVDLSGPVSISRPGGGTELGAWTSTDATLWQAIGETTPNDATFITSPELQASAQATPLIALTAPVAAGVLSVRLRAQRTQASGQLRVVLTTADGTPVGASAWQVLGSSYALYTLPASTTGTATHFRIEARL